MPFAALALIAAAGWSPTQSFDAGAAKFHEPVPRVAIDARGKALLAYETGDQRLVVRVRTGGRFGAPRVLARNTLDYAVAPGAVAYEAKDGIHVAVRSGGGFKDRKVASSTGSEINGVAIAADPLGGWVVAERQFPRKGSGKPYRVRALSLDAAGNPTSPPQDLGLGQFGLDARPTQALAVLPDGRAVLVFQREGVAYDDPDPVVYALRAHGGTFTEPAVVGDGLTDPRVTVDRERGAVLSATMTTLCGDTSCAGQPRAIPLNPDGTLGAPTGPTVARPNRAFAPWAAPNALVFQLKTKVKPFSREAPVRAASLTRSGPLQTLTKELASEPVALPLSGGRTLAVWTTRRGFGAALAGPDGVFAKRTAPAGPAPEIYHSNPTNRDARSAGDYAIVAWSRGHTVRVSVRTFAEVARRDQ
ncbi:hypothetical protein OJ997_23390 [Solirubrobacter phytolaccae]|uniref:Uncharacterized protein n=1 Tax=Solirubrobacter phytolaccae TaxID=1404360 RepID=A0A9X3SD50_9ACTN|nr:hypothetical protein [Solirubrobacter phytolaccae]MDA0183275.1 hypothetical protein [Solirubrobacter phytolaccae]